MRELTPLREPSAHVMSTITDADEANYPMILIASIALALQPPLRKVARAQSLGH